MRTPGELLIAVGSAVSLVSRRSAVLLMVSSANLDERHFEDPDRFDIHRKPGGQSCADARGFDARQVFRVGVRAARMICLSLVAIVKFRRAAWATMTRSKGSL